MNENGRESSQGILSFKLGLLENYQNDSSASISKKPCVETWRKKILEGARREKGRR